MEPQSLRRSFFTGLVAGLKVVWPILSVLLLAIVAMGAVVALLEDWPLANGMYFAFVTSLTIGYGDLVPKRALARLLAIAIGFTGVLLIGLITAIAVHAMEEIRREHRKD